MADKWDEEARPLLWALFVPGTEAERLAFLATALRAAHEEGIERAAEKVAAISWTVAYEDKTEREAAEDMAATVRDVAVTSIRSLIPPSTGDSNG